MLRADEADYGPIGLALQPGLAYDRWEAIGRALWAMEWARLWWLGDWLLYGEQTYGERQAQAEALAGYDYATLSGARWVCSRIPVAHRHERLSFAHHRKVAGLAPAEQARWLAEAERAGWSVQELAGRAAGPVAAPGRVAPGMGAGHGGGARCLPG